MVLLGLYLRDRSALEAKKLSLEERKLAIEERRHRDPTPVENEPLPPVMVQLAYAESEPWAVEDALKAFTEAYRSTKSWGKVQRKAERNADGERWDNLIT